MLRIADGSQKPLLRCCVDMVRGVVDRTAPRSKQRPRGLCTRSLPRVRIGTAPLFRVIAAKGTFVVLVQHPFGSTV